MIVLFFGVILLWLVWGGLTVKPFSILPADLSYGRLLLVLSGTLATTTAFLYATDMVSSARGRNTVYLQKFYKSLHYDLLITASNSLVIYVILSASAQQYVLSNIDIGLSAVPFFLAGIYALVLPHSATLAFRPKKRMIWLMAAVHVMLMTACCLLLVRIHSGQFSGPASLWLQLSIFAVGWTLYVGGKQARYLVAGGRLDFSETHRQLFLQLRGGRPGLYDELAAVAEATNSKLRTLKAKQAADLRSQRRQGKPRGRLKSGKGSRS